MHVNYHQGTDRLFFSLRLTSNLYKMHCNKFTTTNLVSYCFIPFNKRYHSGIAWCIGQQQLTSARHWEHFTFFLHHLTCNKMKHIITCLLVFCLVKKIKHTSYGCKSKNKCHFLELRNFARAHRNKRNSCALRTPFEGSYSLYMEARWLTKVMTPDWECSMYFTTGWKYTQNLLQRPGSTLNFEIHI